VITAIKNFVLLPFDEKKLFFIATFLVLKIRILVTFLPLRFYSSKFGIRHKTLSDSQEVINLTTMHKVKRTIKRTSIYLPFKNKCLVDAFVAKKLLKKLGFESTLFLGVGRDENGQVIAHAWLKYCGMIVTGEKGIESFSEVEWFS
jgi:hypothetical protein